MKVIVPSRLKVGAHWYTVEFQNDYQEIEGCCGMCSKSTLKIIIDNNPLKPASLIGEYFIHELLHTVFNQAGYNKGSHTEFQTTEEELLYRITPVLYQILVDNKIQEEVK